MIYDIVIAGGGYVGRSLALALKQGAPDLQVALVDLRPVTDIAKDRRSSAIAAAARRLLTVLGVWEVLEADAQPICEMVVTDSKLSDSIRPRLLTFGNGTSGRDDNKEGDGEPFAHMLPNSALVQSLADAADALGIETIAPDLVANYITGVGNTDVTLKSGRQLKTRLLVACDGVQSTLRALAGIPTHRIDYGQTAIVGTLAHEYAHEGRAFEHFLPAGPFALLPLPGTPTDPHRSSLVWTDSHETAKRLLADDPLVLDMELQRRAGPQLGDIRFSSPAQGFPLALTLVRDFVRPRLALAGDAAHGIHPIAGQGLNLGFKDVAALSQVVIEAHRLGRDIGDPLVLEDYQRWRRFDTARMAATTDILSRLFATDFAPLRLLRSAGLSLVDRLPPLKQRFIQQAAGNAAGEPRLLRGQAI